MKKYKCEPNSANWSIILEVKDRQFKYKCINESEINKEDYKLIPEELLFIMANNLLIEGYKLVDEFGGKQND